MGLLLTLMACGGFVLALVLVMRWDDAHTWRSSLVA
jgi:hypothetical protein